MAEELRCAHLEHQEQVGKAVIGTCLHCGQVKKYTWRGGFKVVILKAGAPAKANVEGYMKALKQQIPIPKEKESEEVVMSPTAKDKKVMMEKNKYYEDNKEAIKACLLSKGRAATQEAFDIPVGSMIKLIQRFLTDDERAKAKSLRGPYKKRTQKPAKTEAPTKLEAKALPVDLEALRTALEQAKAKAESMESIPSRAVAGAIADLQEVYKDLVTENMRVLDDPPSPSQQRLISKKIAYIGKGLDLIVSYMDE